ncbi:putative ATP-dependent RNA helicase TDRD12 [Sitodiplosis mosellana]|uniref:putative ATP-dependent RNA helicase TDRD12 n=1 Tax=Sitodiplosis mosellana TaxID=263140 RepID=UPI00244530BF|nr:putative ATP-dependent RNA helicase TDRD12 [Sitodiplosis mosellana]
MELNRKIQIEICNIEDSQMFWFRAASDVEKIQSRLEKYLEKCDKKQNYAPKIGDIAIVNVYNEYFIVRVKTTVVSNLVKVSILQNGHKVWVKPENIIELKDQSLVNLVLVSTLLRGSVTGVRPAESILINSSPKTVKTPKWSSQSIQMLKDYIKLSAVVYFQATEEIDKMHFGGILTFEVDFSKSLITAKLAIPKGGIDDEVDGIEPDFLLGKDVSDDNSDTHPIISSNRGSTPKDSNSLDKSDSSSLEKSDSSSWANEIEELSEQSELSNGSSDVTQPSEEYSESIIVNEEIEEMEQLNRLLLNVKLSPIMEHSREDDELTMTSCVDSCDVNSYLYENSETEDEPEQYEYEWSQRIEKERSINAENNLKSVMIEHLLRNATLSEQEPYVYSEQKNDPDKNLPYSASYSKALKRLNKEYPVQGIIWPYLKSGRSSILIGNTDFYPHLLYLPPIFNLVKMLEDLTKPKIKGPNVVIFASNCQEAKEIRQICSCFLKEDSVYTDAEDYSMAFNERKYERCDIYVSLMSRISHDPENIPKSTQRIILNNFDSISSEKRQRIVSSVLSLDVNVVVTSRHYVEELRMLFDQIPNVFVSIESYFDLYYFSSKKKGSRVTEIRIFDSDSKDKQLLKLTDKISFLKPHKVVIACSSAEKAENLAKILWSDYAIETILNQKPFGGAPKVLICSDDQLVKFDVRNANHIIHYDLPENFETFCRRYSVLRSYLDFESTSTVKPVSFIMETLDYEFDKKVRLLLVMLFREYGYTITPPKYKKVLLDKLRRMHLDAPLCLNITTAYTDVGHLIDCENRHCFDDYAKYGESVFQEPRTSQVQILEVFSPVCFSVRILKSRGTETNEWQQHFSPDAFRQFNKEFTKLYANDFAPVYDSSKLNDNALYVLRDGNEFYRCRILTKSNNGTQLRVRLVDFGKYCDANVSNIGIMQLNHTQFPPQSSDLCLLNVVPWNKSRWEDYDTSYALNTLFSWNELGTLGIFETIILWGVQPEIMFALNLFVPDDGNYVDIITQKGIAAIKNNIEDFEDFFQHAIQQKILTVDQRNNIQQSLQ